MLLIVWQWNCHCMPVLTNRGSNPHLSVFRANALFSCSFWIYNYALYNESTHDSWIYPDTRERPYPQIIPFLYKRFVYKLPMNLSFLFQYCCFLFYTFLHIRQNITSNICLAEHLYDYRVHVYIYSACISYINFKTLWHMLIRYL